MAGRPEAGKAAVQAAGCFLGTVTKARDCGEEGPQDGAAAASGDSVCASQVPLHHHEPRTGQPAPTARDHQMGILWHLRDGSPWASVGSKKAGAAQDNTQEAARSVPHTPGKEEKQARKVDAGVGGEYFCISGRQSVSISHLTALPWDLLDVFWKLNSARARSRTSELASQVLGQL